MMFWVREMVGWLLIGLGLLVFLVVYEYCERRWIFEAGILAVIGIFVFRGGIHLLKVAVASRIASQIQPAPAPSTRNVSRRESVVARS